MASEPTPSEEVRVAVQPEQERCRLVFEALGAASMCWTPRPEGVFESTLALAIGEKLLGALAALSLHVGDAADADTGASALPTGLCGLRPEPQGVSALRAPIPGAWQPIETAPKDGSYILVSHCRGAWIAHWAPVAVSGYRFEQPWRSVMLNHDHIAHTARYLPPTHWMPLPVPARGIVSGEAGETEGLDPEGARARPEGARPSESEIAQPSLHIEPVAEVRSTGGFEHIDWLRESLPVGTKLYIVPTTPTEGPAQTHKEKADGPDR